MSSQNVFLSLAFALDSAARSLASFINFSILKTRRMRSSRRNPMFTPGIRVPPVPDTSRSARNEGAIDRKSITPQMLKRYARRFEATQMFDAYSSVNSTSNA